MIQFVIGHEYRRKELHDQYGGGRQGGISPSRQSAAVFLITSPAGHQHGYQYDGPQADGTFWYTGEGQVGDMQMVRGNRAIRDAQTEGRELHLFEEARSGFLRYVGRAAYAGHHLAPAPDRLGNSRQAIVFELTLEDSEVPSVVPVAVSPATTPREESAMWRQPLAQLRQSAIESAPAGSAPELRKRVAYKRSAAVRIYALRRADGRCEACLQSAPFKTAKGVPYLEPHHIRRVSDGGPDHPRWVAAICPNCHARVHRGNDSTAYNEALADRIGKMEETDVAH